MSRRHVDKCARQDSRRFASVASPVRSLARRQLWCVEARTCEWPLVRSQVRIRPESKKAGVPDGTPPSMRPTGWISLRSIASRVGQQAEDRPSCRSAHDASRPWPRRLGSCALRQPTCAESRTFASRSCSVTGSNPSPGNKTEATRAGLPIPVSPRSSIRTPVGSDANWHRPALPRKADGHAMSVDDSESWLSVRRLAYGESRMA
jgi:hypothetical protein